MTQESAPEAIVETVLDPTTEGQPKAATPEAKAPEGQAATEQTPQELSPEEKAAAEKKDQEGEQRRSRAKERIQELARKANHFQDRAERAERERDEALARLPDVDPSTNVEAQLAHRDARDAAYEHAQAANEIWATKIDSEREKYPDFEAVAYSPEVPYSPTMVEAVREHPNGVDIAYYLGQNKDVARRIADLSPLRAAIELGEIGSTLKSASKAPAKRETSAPPPVKPLSGASSASGGSAKKPNEMSMEEYRAYARKRDGIKD